MTVHVTQLVQFSDGLVGFRVVGGLQNPLYDWRWNKAEWHGNLVVVVRKTKAA
jgi:hypothetical protein